MSQIDALQLAGKVDEAVTELSLLLEETPDDPELQLRLAHALTLAKASPKSVIDHLDEVLLAAPQDSRARFLRFQAYMFNNQPGQAAADNSQLCAKFPDYDFLVADRADALLFNNELEACKSHVRRAFASIKMTNTTARRLYVDNVYANRFLGYHDTAVWDVAFMPDRGFERNDELMKLISDSTLVLGDIAFGSNYHIQALDWEKLNKLFGSQAGQQ